MDSQFREVMIDLETLGTRPGSVILSIGAVEFHTLHGLGREFYAVLNVADSVLAGLSTDPKTIQWWENQSPEARQVLVEAHNAALSFPVRAVCSQFAAWLPGDSPSARRLWGNGANFDNVLLDALYDSVGQSRPVIYRNNLCFRTLKALVPLPEVFDPPATPHHALEDAKAQARHAVRLLRRLQFLGAGIQDDGPKLYG